MCIRDSYYCKYNSVHAPSKNVKTKQSQPFVEETRHQELVVFICFQNLNYFSDKKHINLFFLLFLCAVNQGWNKKNFTPPTFVGMFFFVVRIPLLPVLTISCLPSEDWCMHQSSECGMWNIFLRSSFFFSTPTKNKVLIKKFFVLC